MKQNTLDRLDTLIKTIPALLSNITEAEFSSKPSPGKWSKKEILGHLIDSAANNHQRFIRCQYENVPTISYDQNEWNRLSGYNEMDAAHIMAFWASYNKHLLEILKNIPDENLQRECRSADGNTYTLQFLMEDYVVHLEHHLRQIISY